MQENIYKVPKSQWKVWSRLGQVNFNTYYEYFLHNQELFLHPKALVNSDKHWKTTAWNMAWSLADAVSDVTE